MSLVNSRDNVFKGILIFCMPLCQISVVILQIHTLILYIVPNPTVSVAALSDQIVGESLLLECNVTTVMGVTSGVDIVWSIDGSEVQRVSAANSIMYTDLYHIVLLGTVEDGRTYQCEAVINSSPPASSTTSITLDVVGM